MRDVINLSLLYEEIRNQGQVRGLDEFITRLVEKHPSLQNHQQILKDFIINSGVPEIKIMPLKMGLGAALTQFVLISPTMLSLPLENCLYGLFHEVAHQYQYKKYGDKLSYIFLDFNNLKESAQFLKKIENTADNFALRKCRELAQKGIIQMDKVLKVGHYSHFTDKDFEWYLRKIQNMLKEKSINNLKDMDDMLYEFITGEKIKKIEEAL